tara:strand:- start:14869 stop:15546 length:678 start_codon:yes stop_codon:yes gene_type:complete
VPETLDPSAPPSNPHLYISLIAVTIGNLTPAVGVLFYDWSLFDIFYLYWAENILIGAFTAIRMAMSAASWGFVMLIGTLFKIAFFCVHYGMFCFGHGMILFELFYEGPVDIGKNEAYLLAYIFDHNQAGFGIAMAGILMIVITEGIKNIIADRRDARLPQTIMFSPYGRIVILHVTIIFGGLGAQSLGAPIWALALLIALKTGYDMLVVTDKHIISFDKKAKKDT